MGIGMQEQTISTGKHINAKVVAKYALLPGILPRLARMARHFSEFMFVFTQLFGMVGLIDRNHPCLQPENIGLYRFRDVAAFAASNIVWNRKNIPQIVMFFAVILSFLMVIMVCVLFIVNVLLSVSAAQAQFFGAPQGYSYSADQDWALQFLTRIFGVDDMFAPATGTNLIFIGIFTSMLRHYSMAMLVIAAIMVAYLMLMTLTEAARTGKPFGTRFDSIWAPIRIALAIGLLIPISSAGYNGAQLLVFQSAKWGSNLASNVWFSGLSQVGEAKYFSASMSDPGYRFVRDILLVNLCVQMLNEQKNTNNTQGQGFVKSFSVVGSEYITISYGPLIAPDFCGTVKIRKVPDPDNTGVPQPGWPAVTTNQFKAIATEFIPSDMPSMTLSAQNARLPTNQSMHNFVAQMAQRMAVSNNKKTFSEHASEYLADSGSQQILGWAQTYWTLLGRETPQAQFFSSGITQSKLIEYSAWMKQKMTADAQHGWTTAGVFYLRMSSVMAEIGNVVNNPPRVTVLPSNLNRLFSDPSNPDAANEQARDLCKGGFWSKLSYFFAETCPRLKYALQVNTMLKGAVSWFNETPKADSVVYEALGGESFDRALQIGEDGSPINASVSTVLRPVYNALMSLTRIESNDLHPLGTVLRWGFWLLNISIVAMGIGLIPGTIGSIAMTIGTVLFIPGVLLAFWVPMMPFLYFSFAVIEWMFSVMEAVIGMPLWALSLISLEGDGLGKGTNGVKMIFEIVLRPTIIVMSLIASVIVFSAGVAFFNQAIDLYANGYDSGVASSNSGFSNAAVGIGMVFTYMFVIYSLATSSFKLIDAIPDNFGRWGNLPKGFGGNMRVGLSDTQKLLMGAAVVGGVTKLANKGRGAIGGAKDKKEAADKQQAKDDAMNDRLTKIESKLS